MPDTAPLVVQRQITAAAVAANADLETHVSEAPFTGEVTRVVYVPKALITGADTESRTLQLFNRGQAGAGTTKVAELAMVATVNAAADDARAITIITASDADAVVAGDVLEWKSLHVGATGLADPGGEVIVEFTRG